MPRRVAREQWNLWIAHAEPHTLARDEAVTTPWALSVTIANNEAVLITSRHARRVETGPKVVLLEYEETLSALRLSKGPSKDGKNVVATCFLRVRGGRVTDTFELDSADFVRFKVRLGFSGRFDGDGERWLQVEDPVKLLCDTARARLREAARTRPATVLLTDFAPVVRDALLRDGAMRFEENGMVIEHIDVLSVAVADSALAELFLGVQRESVRLQLQEQQAARRLDSARHQDAVDAEQQNIGRATVKRKAETETLGAEASHGLALRALELEAERKGAALEREHRHQERVLEFEVRSERELTEAAAGRKLREAEADAVKLQAVQPELVGALHAAADSEVMKAAAQNMNLVALPGGRSPVEIFQQLLSGTALSRTVRDMRERSGETTPGDEV